MQQTNEQKLERAQRDIRSAKMIARRFPSPRHDDAVRRAIRLFGQLRATIQPPTLTPEDVAELRTYAKANGPHWRQRLSNDWSIGHNAQGRLYRLSISHGRKWLFAFKLER